MTMSILLYVLTAILEELRYANIVANHFKNTQTDVAAMNIENKKLKKRE